MSRDIQSELMRVVSRAIASERAELAASQLRSMSLCFIRAGFSAVHAADVEGAKWVSWGLEQSLPGASVRGDGPISGTASEYEFARGLRDRLEAWRSSGLVDAYFLMRKPPGLRLRLRTATPSTSRDVVGEWLRSALGRKAVRSATYEAEVYQFGGAIGMDIAHEHFTRDTAAMLDALVLAQEGYSYPLEIVSALCIFDLVAKMAGDTWEAWDLWRRMELTGRLPESQHKHRYDVIAERAAAWAKPLLFGRTQVMQGLSVPHGVLIRRYEAANSRLAEQMRMAADQANLLYGVRNIVPFWVVFHWNRWGFDRARQKFMILGVERALSPKELDE